MPRGEPRAAIVERMRRRCRRHSPRLWAARRPDLPLRTPEEALVLASIIEKETAKPTEYPLVAAVFINRLRQGMPLQTDPTVIYALTGGKGPLGRELTARRPRSRPPLQHLPHRRACRRGRSPTRAARALAAALDPAPSTISTSSPTAPAATPSPRPWPSTTATSRAGASCATAATRPDRPGPELWATAAGRAAAAARSTAGRPGSPTAYAPTERVAGPYAGDRIWALTGGAGRAAPPAGPREAGLRPVAIPGWSLEVGGRPPMALCGRS